LAKRKYNTGKSDRRPATSANVGYEAQLWQMADGLCKRAPLEEVRKHGHVLTPGRYVGAAVQEDDGEPFKEKMKRLTPTLREKQAEAGRLDVAIAANLKELGDGG
jgi:type I restriction enzyme M protein